MTRKIQVGDRLIATRELVTGETLTYEVEVIRRTSSTISVIGMMIDGTKRCKVFKDLDGEEYILAFGEYSPAFKLQ